LQKAVLLTSGKRTTGFVYACLLLWSVTTIFPLVWVINNSFKTSQDVVNKSLALAIHPSWQNYVNAFSRIDIGRSYMNSIIMSGSTVLFVLLIAGMAAYILARFRFKIRPVILSLLVLSLLIPAFATVVPVFELLLKLRLLNTYWALIVPHTAGNLPYAVLLLTAYMSSIAREIEEAAIIDGCNRWKIFTHIFIPISLPCFSTCSIFIFLWSYNDLFTSLIFVSQDQVRPIVVLLSQVSSRYGTDYGLMAAVITMTIVPVLIVYLFVQNYIQQGMTAGAVKG
jgi:raffinose/stachyose/melibiose transport system permease protein